MLFPLILMLIFRCSQIQDDHRGKPQRKATEEDQPSYIIPTYLDRQEPQNIEYLTLFHIHA